MRGCSSEDFLPEIVIVRKYCPSDDDGAEAEFQIGFREFLGVLILISLEKGKEKYDRP